MWLRTLVQHPTPSSLFISLSVVARWMWINCFFQSNMLFFVAWSKIMISSHCDDGSKSGCRAEAEMASLCRTALVVNWVCVFLQLCIVCPDEDYSWNVDNWRKNIDGWNWRKFIILGLRTRNQIGLVQFSQCIYITTLVILLMYLNWQLGESSATDAIVSP